MMNKNFKEEIDIKLSNIKIEENMKDKMLKNKKKVRIKRPIALACSICAFMLISVPVLAATLPAFNELIGKINPKIAEILSPINKVIESNGIKIEVLGSANDSETVLTYVTVKDIEEDRIDESIEMFKFNTDEGVYYPFSKLIDYNKETKTATFILVYEILEDLNGKDLVFELESVQGKKKEYVFASTFDINKIDKNPETIDLNVDQKDWMGSGDLSNYIDKKDNIKILKPNKMDIPFKDTDIASISNIGMIEGKLHVQLKWKKYNESDGGYLYLIDKLGNSKDSFGVSFDLDEKGKVKSGQGYAYSEHIMKLDNVDDKISLRGNFIKIESDIKGQWKIPFKVDKNAKEKSIPLNKKIVSANVKNIKITPIGLTITGDGDSSRVGGMNTKIIMKDGSIKWPTHRHCNFSKPEWKNISYYFGLDIDNIKEVFIGEHKIKVD